MAPLEQDLLKYFLYIKAISLKKAFDYLEE